MRFAVAFSCSLALHALAAVLLSLAFGSRGDSAADEKSPPSCVRIAVVTGEGASSAGESSSDEEADRGKTAAANPPSAPRVASVPPSGGAAQEVAPPEPGRPVVEVASFSVSMESLGGGSQEVAEQADAEASPSGGRSAPPRSSGNRMPSLCTPWGRRPRKPGPTAAARSAPPAPHAGQIS